MYDTISEWNIVTGASRWISLLGSHFTLCPPSVFTRRICQNKPLLGHCHHMPPQLPRKQLLYAKSQSTVCDVQLETSRKCISLLYAYIYMLTQQVLPNNIINSSLPKIFLTLSGIRSLLHRWKFPIRNISCFLWQKYLYLSRVFS